MSYQHIAQEFQVNYKYALYFTENLFSPENNLFADIVRGYRPDSRVKVLFVADRGVTAHHPSLENNIREYCAVHADIIDFREFMEVSGGESAKNSDEYVENVLRAIDANHICRHSFVVCIGGGAVIDMAGYAAAIAHRGVKLIRVPTTVLAQNDAAVGVKNGINYFGKKKFYRNIRTALCYRQ